MLIHMSTLQYSLVDDIPSSESPPPACHPQEGRQNTKPSRDGSWGPTLGDSAKHGNVAREEQGEIIPSPSCAAAAVKSWT